MHRWSVGPDVLVQLRRPNFADHRNFYGEAISDVAHHYHKPLTNYLEGLSYLKCSGGGMGICIDHRSCASMWYSTPLWLYPGTLSQSGMTVLSPSRSSINRKKGSSPWYHWSIQHSHRYGDNFPIRLYDVESACSCVETARCSNNLQLTVSVSIPLEIAKPVLIGTRVCGATVAQLVTLRPYFKSTDQTCLFLSPPQKGIVIG